MRILYFDCFSGAAGDMIVGALLDAGASCDALTRSLDTLGLSGYRIRADRVRKQGFAATKFEVELDDSHGQPHRHLADIRKILTAGKLPESVVARSLGIFERLADAEAEAHGTTRDKVHFHEVGAIDAIVDIVGAVLLVEELAPDRIAASALPTGSGTVRCAHGIMPVPAPATANLLKGIPLADSTATGELLTPTGAAILTTLCTEFGPRPPMSVARIGYGAGARETEGLPNVCRVMLGTAADGGAEERVAVLEANLDDASGEWVGHCMSRLLDAGALDAYCVPIYMKKHRPGVILTAVCALSQVAELEAILFAETPTFGVRRHLAERSTLDRRHESVETPYGGIRVKVGSRGDEVLTAAPEYEDCAAAAAKHGTPLREVMQAALDAWRR